MRSLAPFFLALAVATSAFAADPPAPEEMTVEQMMAEAGQLAAERVTLGKKLEDSIALKSSHESSFKLLEGEAEALKQERASATANCKFPPDEWPDQASRDAHMAWCTPTQARLKRKEDDLEARSTALLEKETARVAVVQPVIARFQATESRLKQLQAVLRFSAFKGRNDDCLNEKSDLEKLHQCMQSVWDGGRSPNSLGKLPNPPAGSSNTVVVPNNVTPRSAEDAIKEYLSSGSKPGLKGVKTKEPPAPSATPAAK